MKSAVRTGFLCACALFVSALVGCASPSGIQPRGLAPEQLPLDLARFMGSWYVIGHIPTGVEANAHAAIERYSLREDGDIDVRFLFCEGAADGEFSELSQLGWVYDASTNAEWRVRPLWPLSLAYQILELDPAYTRTVIGHPSLRYAWVMARERSIPDADLEAVVARLAERGFDPADFRRVPQPERSCLDGR